MLVISAVLGEHCPACEETLIDRTDGERVSNAMSEFTKKINASVIDPTYIAGVREKLNLTQTEADKVFGGGTNGFSRYETGKALPSRSLIQLLRLLDHRPELLKELSPYEENEDAWSHQDSQATPADSPASSPAP